MGRKSKSKPTKDGYSPIKNYDKKEEPARCKIYIQTLKKVSECILSGDAENLKMHCEQLSSFTSVESGETLLTFWDHPGNPLSKTNFVIAACEKNQHEVLHYFLSAENEVFLQALKKAKGDFLEPEYEDEFKHNAFYYAIRSNNTQLLNTLIDRYPGCNLAEEPEKLESLLATPYEELRLKNVEISPEMEFCVEFKLIKLRFIGGNKASFCESLQSEITARFALLKSAVERFLNCDGIPAEGDLVSQYNLSFIALNIHVLKHLVKFTYDSVPWEEMEFCIVIYLHSARLEGKFLNSFYQSIFNITDLKKHLENFLRCLQREEHRIVAYGVKNYPNEFPFVQRKSMIRHILQKYPFFHQLYADFNESRDLRSVELIKKYVDLAISSNPGEKIGQKVILRALQVIGECLKNTIESPKMSGTTAAQLLSSMNQNVRKIVIALRNSLAHAASLSKKIELGNRAQNFVDLKNDLEKLNEVITEHLFKILSKIMKSVLEKAMKSKDMSELSAILKPYGRIDEELMMNIVSLFYCKTLETNNCLGKLVDELYEIIPSSTVPEELLYKSVKRTISKSARQNKSRREKYIEAYVKLAGLSQLAEYMICPSSYEGLKFEVKLALNMLKTEEIDPEIMRGLTVDLNRLLRLIETRLSKEAAGKVVFLLLKISNMIEFDVGNLRAIEELQKTLTRHDVPVYDQNNGNSKMCVLRKPIDTFNLEKEFYQTRIKELNELVKSTGEKLCQEDKDPSKYKDNSELQAAIEALVLDIISVLSSAFNAVSANQKSIEDISPLLLGKSMRNYLAHSNDIVALFVRDPSTSLILNAQQLVSFNALNFRLPIGSRQSTSAARLKENDERRHSVVSWQQKLIDSLKTGDLKAVVCCIENGADLAARSMDKMSSIHWASMGSEKCIRFVVDKWKNATDLKDAYGRIPLHIASVSGNDGCVRCLLRLGEYNINGADNGGSTPLHMSASRGHTDVIRVLLDSGADQGIANHSGRTPTQLALFNKHERASKLLLTRANKEAIKDSTFSPLHMAAESGSLEIVHHLLSNGATVDPITEKFATPLHLASTRGHLDVAKALIARGANVNAVASGDNTPLKNAGEAGSDELVAVLLQAGADPDWGGENTHTALFYAARDGNEKIVRLLLESGAQVNICTPDGMTPLHWASLGGHCGVMKLLIDKKADIKGQDALWMTPLHKSVGGGHFSAAKLLIINGAPVNIKDGFGCTPIFYAAVGGFAEITKLLVNSNAHLDVKCYQGLTPLHASSMSGHVDVAKILIEYGSSINAVDTESRTPLLLAAEKGYVDMVKLLLNNRADANIRDNRGFLAVHIATAYGHKNVVLCLIKSNTDQLDKLEPMGYSPLHLACSGGMYNIAELLIQHGCKMDYNQSDKVPSLLELAIESRNIKLVKLLLKKNFPVNENHLRTAVHMGFGDFIRFVWKDLPSQPETLLNDLVRSSCERRQTGVLGALIEKGANVNTLLPADGENKCITLLHLAVHMEYEDVVITLLENGADVNGKCTDGTIPLHEAVIRSNSAIITDLLDYGSAIDTPTKGIPSPLEMAVQEGKCDIVNLLLNQNSTIDLNKPRSNGSPLIALAVCSKSIDTVKLLVERGANIKYYSELGRASHLAALTGSVGMLDYVLSRGMNIDETGAGVNNSSMLHIGAMAQTCRYQMCKYLLVNKSMNPNLIDAAGQSALHVLAIGSKDDVDVARLLLEKGSFYDLKDSYSKMPIELTEDPKVASLISSVDNLFKGVKRGDVSVVVEALGQGAVVDAINCLGETPLICAAWKGFADIVEILLAKKANPDIVGKNGSTPLHYACKFSHESVVMSLLRHGAKFDLVNDSGNQPMDYAAKDSEVYKICAIIKESFASIENDDNSIIFKLLILEEQPDKCKALFNCKNKDGKSFLAAAILSRTSIGDKLKFLCVKPEIIVRSNQLVESGNVQKALDFSQSMKRKELEGYQKHSLMSMELDIHIIKMHYNLKNYQEAIELSRELHETLKEQLGQDHQKTLYVHSGLALALHREDRNEEALKIFKRVIKRQRQLLEPTHQDLLDTQCHLALVLDTLRRFDEALELNYDLLTKYTSVYGAKHPLTLVAQHNIAMVLTNQGNHEEALEIFQKVYKIRQQVLGPNDPTTLRTESNIASVLFSQKKFEEASMAFDQAIKKQSDVLGNNDVDVYRSKMRASMSLLHQGQHKRASELCEEAKHDCKRIPPSTLCMGDFIRRSAALINQQERIVLRNKRVVRELNQSSAGDPSSHADVV